MRRGRSLAWLMLLVWGTWLSALQAALITHGFLGPWVPDLVLILLVALACQLHRRDVAPAALMLALTRTATSVDSAAAILAAFGLLAALLQGLRRLAESNRLSVRFVLVGGTALIWSSWLAVVRCAQLAESASVQSVSEQMAPLLPGVLASACAGVVLFNALLRLPGMTPLRRSSRLW